MRTHTLKGQKIIRCRDKYKPENMKIIMDIERANGYLQDLKKALDELGVPFCLMYGTLVGAIREEDIVCYDHDVDIAILHKDIKDRNLIEELKRKLHPLGYYFCVTSAENRLNFFYIAKRESSPEKVDVYIMFEKGDNVWFTQYINHREQGPSLRAFPYAKHYFENMQEVDFKGARYKVPTPPEDFLEELWGDWWIARGGQWGIIKHQLFPLGTFFLNERKIE